MTSETDSKSPFQKAINCFHSVLILSFGSHFGSCFKNRFGSWYIVDLVYTHKEVQLWGSHFGSAFRSWLNRDSFWIVLLLGFGSHFRGHFGSLFGSWLNRHPDLQQRPRAHGHSASTQNRSQVNAQGTRRWWLMRKSGTSAKSRGELVVVGIGRAGDQIKEYVFPLSKNWQHILNLNKGGGRWMNEELLIHWFIRIPLPASCPSEFDWNAETVWRQNTE